MKHLYSLIVDHFKEILSGLKKSNSFVRNVAYSLSGNTLVLGIGFLLTPVIARIYGPSAYGQFAIFTAISSLIQPLSTFQLPAGYVAAKNREEFFSLVRLSVFFLLSISTLSLVGILFYINMSNNPNSKLYLYIPIYVLFAGFYSIMRGWNIKLQEFKKSAKSKVFAALLGKSSTLSVGLFYTQSAFGLIIGSIVSFISESLGLISKKMLIEAKLILKQKIIFNVYKVTLFNFKQYPTYVTLNTVINNLSNQIPIYFIAAQFTNDNVGLFSLSLSLIQIPLNLMGTSIGAVFLPKISRIIDEKEKRNKTITDLYNKLFYPGIISLIVIAFVLRMFLTPILGMEWSGASYLSSFMAASFSFSIVALPISVVYRLINIEKTNLNLTLIFGALKVFGLVICGIIGNFNVTVFIYFFIMLLHNCVKIMVLYYKLNIKLLPIFRDLLLVIIIYVISYLLVY